MKVVKGSFSKGVNKTLKTKVEKAVDKILEIHGEEATGKFVLVTECEKEIYISSDLPAEEFNFLLDLAKQSVLYSYGIAAD